MFLGVSGSVSSVNVDERERFAGRLIRELEVRFRGVSKRAYTEAQVNSATWKRAVEAETLKPHTVRAITANLWPETQGDWQRIPGLNGDGHPIEAAPTYVSGPGERVEGGGSDDEVLRAIRAMHEDIRTLSERVARLEEDGPA